MILDFVSSSTFLTMKRKAIVWFRMDLRLHDNEALQDAMRNAYEVIPVFVFEDRLFKGNTSFGFPKTGKYRTKFILESVADLRQSLRKLNSDLIIRVGNAEEVLFDLAKSTKTSWIFCNRERTQEEARVQDNLEQKLWSIGQEMRYNRGKMLYYTADLPFPIQHTPDVFTQFRKEVERIVPVREPIPRPTQTFNPLSIDLEPGEIPTLEDFGHQHFEPDPRAVLNFKGGETEGLKRLKYYLWETDFIKEYKESRNGMLGGDYSSKFSPWLAQGCISPKMVYHELKNTNRNAVPMNRPIGCSLNCSGVIFSDSWVKNTAIKCFRKEAPVVRSIQNGLKTSNYWSVGQKERLASRLLMPTCWN